MGRRQQTVREKEKGRSRCVNIEVCVVINGLDDNTLKNKEITTTKTREKLTKKHLLNQKTPK